MNSKKLLVFLGIVLLVGVGLILATPQSQSQQNRQVKMNKVTSQNTVRNWQQLRYQMMYRDMNGDGINDLYRDHDGDGIPNCQDPDWNCPKDGTGYQNRKGQHHQNKHNNNQSNGQQSQFRHGQDGNSPHMGGKASFRNFSSMAGAGKAFTNRSFRQGIGGLGSAFCDGTGPKGFSRQGRR
ncbi:hypothetical protein NLC35_00655 [Candidatus Aminicenantes bacterium AC-334-K16]|jgi:hypothetical protein|nr:hypothetical protein [Candidatus Aminicenantes bacterium AC-334-K16]